MHGTRLAALAATLACALLIGGVGTASAAQTPTTTPMAKKIPITGQAKNGPKIKHATLKIQKFSKHNGKLFANGVVRGTFKGRSFRRTVRVPVRNPAIASGAQSAQLPPIPNACNVLNLRLGPINLNLLGLVVRTNQINVRIDAVPGPGNLLGNLLCGITNALNPGALSGTLQQIVNILNALLALSPSTA